MSAGTYQIQIVFVVLKKKNLNHTEFTHEILKHFPLGHVRIAMTNFSADYTSCQVYRLDDTVGHYKKAKFLYKILQQYSEKYKLLKRHQLRSKVRNRTLDNFYFHKLSKIEHLRNWARKHAFATSKQATKVCRANIKYNLKLTSLCLQTIEKRYLTTNGTNTICTAAKRNYIP
jgi:hypothetical protein